MKPKTKTLLLIAAAFFLGGVAGISIDRNWGFFLRFGHSRMTPAEFRTHFHTALALDSMQIKRVDSLLDSFRGKVDVQRSLMARYHDTLRSDIRLLLTPEQMRRYEEFDKATRAREGSSRRESSR